MPRWRTLCCFPTRPLRHFSVETIQCQFDCFFSGVLYRFHNTALFIHIFDESEWTSVRERLEYPTADYFDFQFKNMMLYVDFRVPIPSVNIPRKTYRTTGIPKKRWPRCFEISDTHSGGVSIIPNTPNRKFGTIIVIIHPFPTPFRKRR